MVVGYAIVGFMFGFMLGLAGGIKLADRNEDEAIQRGTKAVERFKATRSKPSEPLPEYHESVPNSWRDDLK
tara:strand:+ start:420 stop:632 length:213 start_codon:yes stop_codon:yes gene_type:complete